MTYVIDVVAISSEAHLQVVVETKNSEDDDASISTTTWASSVVSAAGESTHTAGESLKGTGQGLLELVRYKLVVNHTAGSGDTKDWVHFRILNPAWTSNGA